MCTKERHEISIKPTHRGKETSVQGQVSSVCDNVPLYRQLSKEPISL